MNQTSLPVTSYTVLGILSFGEALSGYDIRQWAQALGSFYRAPAQSQIYSELRRLEGLGYVRAEEIEQQGKPDKRMYLINPLGEQAFERWLNEASVGKKVLKHPVVLRLFFGHLSRPGRLRTLLSEYEKELEEKLAQLAIVQEYNDNHPGFSYPARVSRWMSHYCQAELDITQEMLAEIER